MATVSETDLQVLDEESLQQLYTWIDGIPLSRPKKNITRDFSDGVLIAEIIHHFIPKMVDMHNYTAANSSTTKLDNWNLLSRKCFTKLNYNIDENLVKGAVSCKAGSIELILQDVRQHVESYLACKKAASLVEKQKYHDHLSPDSHNYNNNTGDQLQYHMMGAVSQDGYNGSHYGFSGYSTDPPQSVSDSNFVQYHYQSQPLAAISNPASGHSLPPEAAENCMKSNSDHPLKQHKPVTQASKMKTKPIQAPKMPSAVNNENNSLRIALEEKEQALLASQETVQILQAKIRRLEHLLHLKDLRINEIKNQQQSGSNVQLQQQTSLNQDHHLPPNQNFAIHQQPPPPHGFSNFAPRPPLPQIPQRPVPDEPRKFQR